MSGEEHSQGPCPQCEHRRALVAAELPSAEQVARWWLDRYRSHYPTAFRNEGDAGLVIVTQLAHVITTARLDGARWNDAATTMHAALQVLLDATKSIYPEEGAAKAVAMLRAAGIELED